MEGFSFDWIVFLSGQGVNENREENREDGCLYISPKHWDLSEGAWIGVPRSQFSSPISLQSAFFNPFIRLYKRLFPLGHMKYLPPVMIA